MNPFRVGWSIAIGLFILIFVAACWFFYSRLIVLETALRGQQPQIQALDEKLKARAKIDLFDLQERCSNQARKEFQSLGWKSSEGDIYSNHYNPELHKCFMLIESHKGPTITKNLSDAYEGRTYGHYFWMPDKIKKYWEAPPRKCEVTVPSGEVKSCNSDDEFTSLIKIYMEDQADQKTGKPQSPPQK